MSSSVYVRLQKFSGLRKGVSGCLRKNYGCSHRKNISQSVVGKPFFIMPPTMAKKNQDSLSRRVGSRIRSGGSSSNMVKCNSCGHVMPVSSLTFNGTSLKCERCHHDLRNAPPQQIKKNLPVPQQIVEHLNKYVVGQENAKKVLAVAVYNHYKRISWNQMREPKKNTESIFIINKDSQVFSQQPTTSNLKKSVMAYIPAPIPTQQQETKADDTIKLEKSNILMLGPTGTGKTYIAQVLSGYLDVPLVICDCTSLTQAGYVGEDVETVVGRLYANAKYDIDKCQQGIIFLDEVDKICKKRSHHRDVGGEGVQQGLLKMMEGSTIKVADHTGKKNAVSIDTTNILFVVSGAFSGIEKTIKKRLNVKTLGFSSSMVKHSDDTSESLESCEDSDSKRDLLIKEIEVHDLINFGMIPEFMGRIPSIVTFESLTTDMLIRILKEPKNALIPQFQESFKMDECKLTFEEEALVAIAERAKKTGTGARALRAQLENILLQPSYEVPDSDIGEVLITKETVVDNKPPIYTHKPKDITVAPNNFIIKQSA